MADMIFCIMGAMIGAGFASGREVMQFFSQYGTISWALILSASALTGIMMYHAMQQKSIYNSENIPYSILIFLSCLSVGGGMAAAAGNLTALTIPFHHARSIGLTASLVFCVFLTVHSLRGMTLLGKILLPAMFLLIILCLRVPKTVSTSTILTHISGISAFIQMIGYCGMNMIFSSSVLSETGGMIPHNRRKVVAFLSAAVFGGLLALSNQALLPHAEEMGAASLPTVFLMKAYGKIGFYYSAIVLYLAVITTLIAVLRGMNTVLKPFTPYSALFSGMLVAAASLIGFQEIVKTAYPALGWAYLFWLGLNYFKKAD